MASSVKAEISTCGCDASTPSSKSKFVQNANHYNQETTDLYDKLLDGNKRFVKDKLSIDPNFFSRLAAGQSPSHLLIGCADSRVPPDQLTKTEPGELFIHRNVANLVVNTDMNFMAVLQYAVEVLKVKHVIVMGHYGCGGVKAAMSNQPHGLIDKWLRNIKDVIRLHRYELYAIEDSEARFRRLVELNVEEQVFNIFKTSVIQQAWASGFQVQVHGWVYEIGTGIIQDLHIEKSRLWEEIESLYEFDFTGVHRDVTIALKVDEESDEARDFVADLPTFSNRTSAQLVHSELDDEPADESLLKHPLRRMRSSMVGQDLKIASDEEIKASKNDTSN